MAKVALCLVMLACAGCARYVRAPVPPAIYDCKPTVGPAFIAGAEPAAPFALSRAELHRFQVMVLQAEACLLAWREWSN